MMWSKQGKLWIKIATISGMTTMLLATMHAGAQYSPKEMAMLPEYCKYTQLYRSQVVGGNDPVKIEYWYRIFGGSVGAGIFHSMHHYCAGLTSANHAKFWPHSPQERQFKLQSSINEFDYVIRASQPDEKMLPEFLTKKGESLIALGNGPLAIAELERAIVLKPDYWPPYAAMSDYYKETGNFKMAREVLERGLSSSPDTRALTRRLAELNATKGKPNAAAQPPRKPAVPKSSEQEKLPQAATQAEKSLAPIEK